MRGLHKASAAAAFIAVLFGLCCPSLAAKSSQSRGKGKHLIRLKFREGRRLKYRLQVKGGADWKPRKQGLTWGKLDTEFTFKLEGKTIRDSGACTFDLAGERLKSTVKGPKGTLSVSATRSSWEVSPQGGRRIVLPDSPLKKPMTITIGPRGGFRGSTGLYPILPCFAVHVDLVFWTLLTVAPAEPVGVGDEWAVDFNVQLPDSRGKPLHVAGKGKVTGWEKYRGRRCLVIKLEAKAELEDTTITLRNGDSLHIKSGKYEVAGKAMWDVDAGLLCSAEAECELKVISDKPSQTTLTGQATSKLTLVSGK